MSKQTAYKNSYNTAHYDRINLTVPKGMKALIAERAKSEGKSVNGFIADHLKQVLSGAPIEPSTTLVQSKKNEGSSRKDMDIFLF